MKLRSLLMVGALLLGGCAVNPYGGTPAPVGEPDKPVSQPEKPVAEPEAVKPPPKPVAPTGLAVALADDFLKAADVQALAGSSPVLLLMAPQNGTGEAFSTQPLACPFSCVRSDCPMPLYRGQSSSHKANLIL